MKNLSLAAILVLAAACGGGGGNKADAPPKDTGVGSGNTCGSANAFGTCDSGNKCTWIIDTDDPTANSCAGTVLGHVGCAPVGDKQLGDECFFSACNDSTTPGSDGKCDDGKPAIGADDCGLDTNGNYMFCISHHCEQVCDVNGGTPSCDSDHSCSQYENTYGTASSAIAGVCDERCDPVTQRTLDTQREACGSVNAQKSGSGSAELYPNFGCYEDDNADQSARLVDFTCSDTPFGRTAFTVPPQCGLPVVTDPVEDREDCTDQESCTVTDQGMEFTIPNGCAPGYDNLIGATNQTGAQVICSAFCAPLDSDTTTPAADIGDPTALGKDVTDAAAKAGRATCNTLAQGGKAKDPNETCTYGWQFGRDTNTGFLPINAGPRDIDKIGICQENADYTYDPTGGSNATKPFPNCGTLTPGQGCTTTEDTCGSGALCIDDAANPGTATCHILNVACGSGTGSDKNNEGDCFAIFHGCYNSIEEGEVDPSAGSGSASTPDVVRHAPKLSPAVLQRQQMTHRVNQGAKFRRPGGIHI